MKTILKTLLPATAALVFSSMASGQEISAPGADMAQGQIATSTENKVVRYSAGDSIPLGYLVQAKEMPVQNEDSPKPTPVRRYSAGDSIALGITQPLAAGTPVEMQSASSEEAGWFSTAARLPLAGALADSVTTNIGLNQPGIAEKNGLINTSPAGLVGLFVIKAGIVYFFDHQTPALRKSGLKAAAGVWNGVAMNNILLIAGASNPLSLLGGALFGAFMYHQQEQILKKEDLVKSAQRSPVHAR